MCFNIMNRLTWVALVLVSIVVVIGLGMFAYVIGAVGAGERELVLLGSAFVVETLVVVAYFVGRIRRSRRSKVRIAPPLTSVPWYNPPLSLSQRIYESPPPAESTPHHPSPPIIIRGPRSGEVHTDTRPMRRVEVPRLPTENMVEEDTKPTKAVPPVTPRRKPLPPGPYDDLFPPAQPGDDDYLETSHMEPVPEEKASAPPADTQNDEDKAEDEQPPEPPTTDESPPDNSPS